MYSETHHIVFSAMPKPDRFQEDMDKFQFQVAERPISEFHDESVSNSTSSESHSRAPQAEKKAEEEKDEDDDGYRTPTSLEHRIPEAKQCPPPPRKIKSSLKRKANSTTSFRCRIRNPLDLSKDLNLLLFPTQHNPFPDSHQNLKKSRRKCNIITIWWMAACSLMGYEI